MSSPRSRFLTVSDFNAQPLADLLNNPETDPVCEVRVAPFGQVTRCLLEIAAGGTASGECDGVIVWTRAEAVIAGYDALLKGGAASVDAVLAEVESFASTIINAAARLKHLIAISNS